MASQVYRCTPTHQVSTCTSVHLYTCTPVHLYTVHWSLMLKEGPVYRMFEKGVRTWLYRCAGVQMYRLTLGGWVHTHLCTCTPRVQVYTCTPVHLFCMALEGVLEKLTSTHVRENKATAHIKEASKDAIDTFLEHWVSTKYEDYFKEVDEKNRKLPEIVYVDTVLTRWTCTSCSKHPSTARRRCSTCSHSRVGWRARS